jgi:hypothetical protein
MKRRKKLILKKVYLIEYQRRCHNRIKIKDIEMIDINNKIDLMIGGRIVIISREEIDSVNEFNY